MNQRVYSACLAAALALGAQAQVRVDKPVELNGTTANDRQVIGLHDAANTGDAMNARSLQRGTYVFASVSGGTAWQADVQPAINQAQAGLCLLVRSADSNSGAVTLSVNGSAPLAVVKEGDQPLSAGDILAGETVSLVFDGTVYQLISARRMDRRPCPSGTAQVNELYCIETAERDTMEFDDAAVICGQQGMRLCTWGQWYAACVNATTLGLQAMTGEWEWTNSAANSDGQARVVGSSSCTHAGASQGWSLVSRNFRCCFNR